MGVLEPRSVLEFLSAEVSMEPSRNARKSDDVTDPQLGKYDSESHFSIMRELNRSERKSRTWQVERK